MKIRIYGSFFRICFFAENKKNESLISHFQDQNKKKKKSLSIAEINVEWKFHSFSFSWEGKSILQDRSKILFRFEIHPVSSLSSFYI